MNEEARLYLVVKDFEDLVLTHGFWKVWNELDPLIKGKFIGEIHASGSRYEVPRVVSSGVSEQGQDGVF